MELADVGDHIRIGINSFNRFYWRPLSLQLLGRFRHPCCCRLALLLLAPLVVLLLLASPYVAVDPAAGNSLAAVSVHIVPAIPAFLLLLASLLLLNFLSVAGIPSVGGMSAVAGMITIVVVHADVSSCCRPCRCMHLVLAVDPALVDVHTSLGFPIVSFLSGVSGVA